MRNVSCLLANSTNNNSGNGHEVYLDARQVKNKNRGRVRCKKNLASVSMKRFYCFVHCSSKKSSQDSHRLIYCFRPFVTCVMCSFHSKKCFDAFQSISIIFGIYQEILHFCSSAYNFVHWEWLTNHWIPWLNENYSICRSLDWRAIECGRFKLNSNCNVATHFKKKNY